MTPLFDELLSFRSYLNQAVYDFSSCFHHSSDAADLLAELVVVLANYKEEGIHLYPALFITDNLDSTLDLVKGCDPITIGTSLYSRQTIRTAFRQCAPLAGDRQWAVFIESSPTGIRYGVFRTDQCPLSPTAFERLRKNRDQSFQLTGLTRLGGSFIELRSVSGSYRYIDVSGTQEEGEKPPKLIREFVKSVSFDAPAEYQQGLSSFYYQTCVDLLHSTHGTLIAIIPESYSLPSTFRDGITLTPKIKVLDGVSEYIANNDTSSFQKLTALSLLLRKMTSMDGITVLDTAGSIIAYNCFVQKSLIEAQTGSIFGGARRRAYEALRALLGNELVAVLYRSQDGAADFVSSRSHT